MRITKTTFEDGCWVEREVDPHDFYVEPVQPGWEHIPPEAKSLDELVTPLQRLSREEVARLFTPPDR